VDSYLDGLFTGTSKDLPDAVRRHFADCPRCAELYRLILTQSGEELIPDGLGERIRVNLHRDLRPVKPLPSTRVLALRFLAILVVLGVPLLFFMGGGGLERMSVTQLAAVTALLGGTAILLAVSLSWQMVPGGCQRISIPLLLAAFGTGFSLVVAALFPWEGRGFVDAGWECAGAGLLISVPVGAVLLYLVTRGAPLSFGKLGASLGAASGLLGLTVLQFHCPIQDAAHVLFSHGSILVLSTAAGAILGLAAERLSARRSR